MAQAVERYRLKGDKALRPDWIADDGQRMFLRWSEDKPMPAVFAVDDTGREMTVDGFMRNGAIPSTGSGRSSSSASIAIWRAPPACCKGQERTRSGRTVTPQAGPAILERRTGTRHGQ
jgi:hypothetical protein